jgi:TolB-like protein/Tfp pilus assembly protein PilF
LKLFLSYARADRAWAERLIHALNSSAPAAFDVWWDALLEGGENFLPATEAALTGADVVVVLWSATSVASHWVRDEATSGRDRRRLVPISIDGTQPPLGFRQFQVIDMAGWQGKADAPDIRKVISAIHAVAGMQQPAPATTAPRAPPGRTLDRRLLLAGGSTVLAAAGGVVAWRLGTDDAKPAVANSIAVLPFRNLSGDPGRAYFAEGLAEELRTTLSLNRQLLVSGAGSAGSFRDADADTRKIAGALGVTNLLTGSVRLADARVRLSARLVDGTTGFERWSQTFDRAMSDVLAVQAEIAGIVADALISTLAKDPDWRAERPGGTRNADAFDAYARGQALYQKGEDDAAALAALDRAIAVDPAYAAAHAARARTLAAIANQDASIAAASARRGAALASARKAIALAPDMAEGHAALGFLLMTQLDIAGARPAYQRCFELGLGNAPILSAHAEYSANIGAFAAAEASIKRALQLDPLNPAIFRNAGTVAFAARDYRTATQRLATALSFNPRQPVAHRILGDIALFAGDVTEARRHYAAEPSALSRLRGLAIADARLSGAAAGEAQMARLVAAFGEGGLYQQAEVLAQWGRTDAALTTLERALAVHDSGLVLAGHDPMLDPLRKEPRFAAILARIGLA